VIASEMNGALLEREAQLHALEAAAAGEGGRLVLVSGEAGAGKTSLVRAFCARLEPDARALTGSCELLFTPRPLGAFLDIAERLGVDVGDAPPHRLAAELARAIAGPAVIVVEDVHWADEASLDVLRLLAGRIAELRALLVCTFRDDELGREHPLQLLLGELATLPRVERLRVEPLSLAAVRTLSEPLGADADAVFAKTGGNPFFVSEVLAAGDARIPETVRDAVLARAARLPREARRLLEAAAIVPARVELALLEELAGGDLPALELCLAAGILRADGHWVAFRHELARLAIESAAPPDRLLALHREALRALRSVRPRADATRLAHHAAAAGDADAVLEHAPAAAARAAAVGAHAEAAAQLGRALAFAERLPVAAQADLYERWAYECHLVDRLDDALAGTAEALARRRAEGQDVEEASTLRLRSKLLWYGGRAEEAERAAALAVERLEPRGESAELARAYALLAHLAMLRGTLEGTQAWGAKAIATAERAGAADAQASAHTSMGTLEFLSGDDAGLERLERGLALARAGGADDQIARALVNLAWVTLDRPRLALAERHIREGLSYTADRDLGSCRGLLLVASAQLELERARFDAAAAIAESVLRAPRLLVPTRLGALIALGRARARAGAPGADGALDEALARCTPADRYTVGEALAAARAEAAWLSGRLPAVAEELEDAWRFARGSADVWAVAELAWWRDKLRPVAAAAVPGQTPFHLQLAGRPLEAARAWRQLGCPYQAAIALSEADAPPALEQALAELHRLGAGPAARIVSRRLRELGVRRIARGPRRATRANAAQLTARELDVLALVADGLRNAEIAARLYVSPKTVDHHVGAILRKLAVHSRRDAVSEARARGIPVAVTSGG
jgi:DNA-binding CsgD family transcriptional regulator